jgi:nucleotide-binding universal stress UspA family protein
VIERILIAVDGSASGLEAVEFGLDIAEKHSAKVTFFHSMEPIHFEEWRSNVDTQEAAVRDFPFELDDAEKATLDDATLKAAARGLESNVEIASGDPVAEIIAHADAMNADLIVVGSRGRAEVASGLVGSVSRGVLEQAPRPVLVVRHRL